MESSSPVQRAYDELPPLVLRSVAKSLWPDGKALSRFCCTCTSWRSVVDQKLWRHYVERRFGTAVLPATRPSGMRLGALTPPFLEVLHTTNLVHPTLYAAGRQQPAQLDGWVFYQGMKCPTESSEEVITDHVHSNMRPSQLAEVAAGMQLAIPQAHQCCI